MIIKNYTYIYNQLFLFLYKQSSAALFGGILLFSILATKYISLPGIYRYDLLLYIALATQAILIFFKKEHPPEILAIVIFHALAMVMELYKTSSFVGSWSYPEKALFAIGAVPIFTGFMYSAVGSYIARSWRINKFEFTHFPKFSHLSVVAILIYINFFTNHFIYDFRYVLFFILIILFWKTKFYFQLTDFKMQLHPLITNFLLTIFIWIGEQVGTFARAWVYPHQTEAWRPVSFHMFTSWYMLLVLSFIIIAFLCHTYDKKTYKISFLQ